MRLLQPTSYLIALLAWTLACGTLLYPERRDMKPDRVDPIVVLMDGALLFVFVIPGVIAFAVDIATGAIYEPEGEIGEKRENGENGEKWALRSDLAPVRLTASQARALELRLPPEAGTWRPGSVWWETADGERIPTRAVFSGQPGLYRLESQAPLAPGLHRLVVANVDGTRHGVPVIVL